MLQAYSQLRLSVSSVWDYSGVCQLRFNGAFCVLDQPISSLRHKRMVYATYLNEPARKKTGLEIKRGLSVTIRGILIKLNLNTPVFVLYALLYCRRS